MFDNKTSIDNNYIANGICPSPTGEARWGLMSFSHSNQFLPLGKARMGYPSGEARWGLKSIGGVIIKNFMRSRFILVYRLYAFARW